MKENYILNYIENGRTKTKTLNIYIYTLLYRKMIQLEEGSVITVTVEALCKLERNAAGGDITFSLTPPDDLETLTFAAFKTSDSSIITTAVDKDKFIAAIQKCLIYKTFGGGSTNNKTRSRRHRRKLKLNK